MKYILLIAAIISIFCGVAFAGDAVFTISGGVRVEIVESTFDKDIFQITGCENNGEGCLINGHIPFGSDLDIPKTYVKSIVVTCKGHSYLLDPSDMYNAWGNRPLELKGVRYFGGNCYDEKNCQFRGLFSDGAGSFVAEWRIVNGMPVRTVLTNSNDVVNLFIKHIDPPVFE